MATLPLSIDTYRTEYFRILSTEDIFTQLEDNIVTLGNMKVSRYVEAFASEVCKVEWVLLPSTPWHDMVW